MDWQKAAGEMWDSRRWSPEKTRDTLDKWQTANDRQRADIIAELDPRQKALAPQDRRLDPQWLYQQGQLSAQDARLLNNAAYGTNPDFASLPSAFEQWAKNSPSEAARDYRKQQAALPKLSLWQSALTDVVNRLPGGAQVATILGMINSSERSRIGSITKRQRGRPISTCPHLWRRGTRCWVMNLWQAGRAMRLITLYKMRWAQAPASCWGPESCWPTP